MPGAYNCLRVKVSAGRKTDRQSRKGVTPEGEDETWNRKGKEEGGEERERKVDKTGRWE